MEAALLFRCIQIRLWQLIAIDFDFFFSPPCIPFRDRRKVNHFVKEKGDSCHCNIMLQVPRCHGRKGDKVPIMPPLKGG